MPIVIVIILFEIYVQKNDYRLKGAILKWSFMLKKKVNNIYLVYHGEFLVDFCIGNYY